MTSHPEKSQQDAIVNGLAEARLMIAYARGRIALDRPVDVLPIQLAVDTLCADVAALGPDGARPFLDRLSLVDDDLASLIEELTPAAGDPRRLDDAPPAAGTGSVDCRP